MKYTYAYKTSDGKRHVAEMKATSREEVFVALRMRGIRAIKVVAEDGSKANGEVFVKEEGRRKKEEGEGEGKEEGRRGWVWAGLAVFSLLGILVYLGNLANLGHLGHQEGQGEGSSNPSGTGETERRRVVERSPRHQIYGDPATMEAYARGDFRGALPRKGDRLLARFAQPGKILGKEEGSASHASHVPHASRAAKTTAGGRLTEPEAAAFEKYAADELGEELDLAAEEGELRETRELKAIVNGMREEMRAYLAAGTGTPRSYWRRLNERTATEARIYERTRAELENEPSSEVWEKKNDALRRIGLLTITHPEE